MKGERIQPLAHWQSRYVRPSQEGAITRLKRSRLAFVLFLVVLLGLFIILTHTPWRQQLLFPGALSSQHGSQQDQCISCHVRANDPVMSWLWHTMQPLTLAQQSQGCMSCHQHKHQKGVVAHGLDEQAIRTLLPKNIEQQQADRHLSELTSRKPLGCFNCHTEHQGTAGELTKLSDTECDSCHLKSQQDFAKQHSDFSLARDTGIQFNHDRHQGVFSEQGKVFQCQQCHGSKAEPVFPKFDQQCLSCHEETIEKPVVLLALPRVATKTPDIGEWPKQRGNKRLSAAMLALLAEYGVPEKPTDKSKKATQFFQQQLAKGYKQLVQDILQDNLQEAKLLKVQGKLMAEGLFKEADAVRLLLHDCKAVMPLLTNLQEQWFPSLLKAQASPTDKPKKAQRKALKPDQQWGTMGNWQLTRKGSVVVSVNHHARVSEIKRIEKQLEKGELSSEDANTGCLLCHQIQDKKIVWQYQPKPPMPTFKFKHQPHLVGQPETVCLNCHTRSAANTASTQQQLGINSEETSETEEQQESSSWLFSPVTKQPCVSCHKEERVGENCLLCHNYHFEEAPWAKALKK
ncbi:hypothetical protein H0A36_05635 [Endozoicomonas sp. SM1973]|uniref:Uncharacterized protein n=1 Tax=Spartinivicinus marinus TaxID=2994442 RepID=A0A853I5R8_9GAMM|nr:hypothetical protein [Spartinivicinus marinus]MCX4028933.1 hypothetical protein [Spartinivicinus marinus]NYZ65484.1 hypothetical protein [Spartinivicinus marinus]